MGCYATRGRLRAKKAVHLLLLQAVKSGDITSAISCEPDNCKVKNNLGAKSLFRKQNNRRPYNTILQSFLPLFVRASFYILIILVTLTVMFTSAAIFSYFEGWDLFTSWYFFFISCSTIGLGDVVPSKPEFMIVALGVMFVGLAMVTVCFNVIQEKLELMFMEMLQKIMEVS